jgi:iron complex outermembrane receptor protein
MIMRATVFTLLMSTSLLTAPVAALAQQAAPQAEVDQVVVTGSRLQNAGFQSPTPLTSLGSAQIQQRSPGAIADVLSEIPTFRQSSGPTQSQRNLIGPAAGQSTSDLRGLGSSRTLTLVNGRRFVGQNVSNSVDTQVIPAGLIDRVEVVTGGASAAYGSDAVAGVVNFILKDRMEGVSGSFQLGTSQRGDNNELGVTLSGGRRFAHDRGHVVLGVDYNRNEGIGTIYRRKRTSIEPGNTANPIAFSGANRPAGVPAQGFLPMIEFSAMTKGSVITTARTANGATSTALNLTAFDASGGTYLLGRGTVYGNLMQGVTTNSGATPLSNWGLKTPNNRATAMALVNYDVTDNVKANLEVTYARTDIDGFSSFHTQPTVTILRDNPFLPTAIRDRMVALNLAQIDIGRVDTEWGGAQTHNTFNTLRIATGLNGEFGDSWKWDVYVQHGRTIGDTTLYHTRESNLQAAQYAVRDASGSIVCGPLATNPNFAASRLSASVNPAFVLPGCVPFNPFGIGQASQAAINYVSGLQTTKLNLEQNVAAASIAGDLFELPAGAISVATGVEHRRDSLRQTSDPLQELGIYTNGNNKSYSGANKVTEGFVEVGVPLLRDLPLAKSLELNGAVRRTHYATSGWVTTWKLGVSYEPTDFLRFRATQSRDIRAPTLAELFSFGGTSAAANLITNPFNGQSARLPATNRGNPNLTPEVADTLTAGVVFQPQWSWLTGLRASVDFYKIELTDVIAAVSSTETLNRCFQGVQAYCAAIDFDNSPYGIRNVNTQPFNQAALNTNGIDIEVAYRVPMDALNLPGRLDIRALANWTDDLERIDRAGAGSVIVDYAGSSMGGGAPSWTGNVNINYAIKDTTVGLQARLFSSIMYDPRLKAPGDEDYNAAASNSINVNHFPSIPYFSLNAAQGLDIAGRRITVFGLVTNLLDRQAPYLAIAALNSGGNPYDFVGRSFKIGARFQW